MLGAHTFLLISREETAFLSEFYETLSTTFLIKTTSCYTLGSPHEILTPLLNILFCFYSLSSKVSYFVLLWEVIFLYLAELVNRFRGKNKVI